MFIEPDAEVKSYEWGVSHWGSDLAEKWMRELYSKVFALLAISPTGCAIAPDADIEGREIRQMFVGRYRIYSRSKGRTFSSSTFGDLLPEGNEGLFDAVEMIWAKRYRKATSRSKDHCAAKLTPLRFPLVETLAGLGANV